MDSALSGLLSAGTLLVSRYRIQSVLGQGGMGAVYLAQAEALDKPVAVKEMRVTARDPAHRQDAVEQFRQEARFLARLSHPNLVQVTDFFEEGGRHYLVMAYVRGTSLAQAVRERAAPFPVDQVLSWGEQLASVLEYLHGQKPPLLFRDLKPGNVMLTDSGQLCLIDFGLARAEHPGQDTVTFLQGVGSAGYAPLEQYPGAGGTDARSDIYSLGAVLYFLLTAQVPPTAALRASQGDVSVCARELNPEVPPALDRAIATMMALSPDQRFSSAPRVLEVLAGLQVRGGETENLGASLDRDEEKEARAYLQDGERVIPLIGPDVILGRQAPAQLIFSYPQISRSHLRLLRTEKGYTVVDLESRFGTFLNGQPVGADPKRIQDGDELVLGGVLSLRFRDPSQTQGGRRIGRLKGVWVDPESQDVWLDGHHLSPPLSAAQLVLLKLLESRPGSFVSREELVAAVWPDSSVDGVSEEAVDGLIKRLRGRLREAGRDPIEVRRGMGLRLSREP